MNREAARHFGVWQAAAQRTSRVGLRSCRDPGLSLEFEMGSVLRTTFERTQPAGGVEVDLRCLRAFVLLKVGEVGK